MTTTVFLDDYLEEDEESEEEENVRPEVKKVSAFTLDKKPISKNEIIKTESIQILQKKEKSQLIPTKTEGVEVKATEKRPLKFEVSQTQSLTAEAQTVETKESATEPQKPELEIVKLEKTVIAAQRKSFDEKKFAVSKLDGVLAEAEKPEKRDVGMARGKPELRVKTKKSQTKRKKRDYSFSLLCDPDGIFLGDFLEEDEESENYNESQIMSDKTFETLDEKGRISFTEQGKGGNFLGRIEEADEIQEDDKEDMLPKLRKMGQQMLDYLNSDYWKNDVMWNKNFETHNRSVKEAIRRLLEYIEEKNKKNEPFVEKIVPLKNSSKKKKYK